MTDPKTGRRRTGAQAEALAAKRLAVAGYTIVEGGWRCPIGEIDLVARQGAEWVFVEVRARRNAEPDSALESIGKRKQLRLSKLAHAYLAEHALTDVSWRIDVVAVSYADGEPPHVEIIENAIGW